MSKVVRLGELPLKLGLFAYYNAVRPNADQDPWQLQATPTFVFSRATGMASSEKGALGRDFRNGSSVTF